MDNGLDAIDEEIGVLKGKNILPTKSHKIYSKLNLNLPENASRFYSLGMTRIKLVDHLQ